MKILILWSSLADYTLACFAELAKMPNVELNLVYQPPKSEAPFDNFNTSFCTETIIDKYENKNELILKCAGISPNIIIMASWNYPQYMSIAKQAKKKGTFVLSTFDGQWQATLRQRFASLISPIYLKRHIDNFLVPGDRQAQFARRLGYKNPLTGFYCANSNNFLQKKSSPNPGKFLFVGRLIDKKGIPELVEAYKIYRQLVSDPWDLTIAGTGKYHEFCSLQEGVNTLGFIQPRNLPDVLSDCQCLILPSKHEPWGVVIHEAALSGLLIISSHQVGASTWFVRDGENGFVINPDTNSLAHSLKKVSETSYERLQIMSDTSRKLGLLWTTNKWADYLYNYFLDLIKDRAFDKITSDI